MLPRRLLQQWTTAPRPPWSVSCGAGCRPWRAPLPSRPLGCQPAWRGALRRCCRQPPPPPTPPALYEEGTTDWDRSGIGTKSPKVR